MDQFNIQFQVLAASLTTHSKIIIVLVCIMVICITVLSQNYYKRTGTGWSGLITCDSIDTDQVYIYVDSTYRSSGMMFHAYHRGDSAATHSDVLVNAYMIISPYKSTEYYRYDTLNLIAKASAESTWYTTVYQFPDSILIETMIDTSVLDTGYSMKYSRICPNYDLIEIYAEGTGGQNDSGSIIYYIIDMIKP